MKIKQLFEKTRNGYVPFTAEIKIEDIEGLKDKLGGLKDKLDDLQVDLDDKVSKQGDIITGDLTVTKKDDDTGGTVNAKQFTSTKGSARSRYKTNIDSEHIEVSHSIITGGSSVSGRVYKTNITPEYVESVSFVKHNATGTDLLAGDGNVATPIENSDIDSIIV